jgi:small subunit ribosomal protein S24
MTLGLSSICWQAGAATIKMVKAPGPGGRLLSTSAALRRASAGRYRVTLDRSRPLTYEMAFPPEDIGVKKGHNSFNTAQLEGTFLHKEEIGQDLPYKMLVEDMFIRKFMHGTWPEVISGELIIKRQHNLVRLAFVLARQLEPRKVYFLIGYTEEMLSYWLKCPVRLEIQSVNDEEDLVYKYI